MELLSCIGGPIRMRNVGVKENNENCVDRNESLTLSFLRMDF